MDYYLPLLEVHHVATGRVTTRCLTVYSPDKQTLRQ